MKEDLYTLDCIRTFSGLYMNVFEPTFEMICIEDIAHALSQQPRFGGHLPLFYSVGQHCLNCSYLCDSMEDKLAALLHDAGEAYLLDIPRPIKNRLSNYKSIEKNLMKVISKKFEFQFPLPNIVKKADEDMLNTEWHFLMLGNESWKFNIYDEAKTESTFLTLYKYYSGEVKKMNELREFMKTPYYKKSLVQLGR